jgi:oligopeptide/dipeptide ABC transporter ATP-binding protein
MNGRGEPLLDVRRLGVEYPVRSGESVTAVRDVSFVMAKAEVSALVGESGSGKTSLARAVLQLLPAAAGEIHFRGRRLAESPAAGGADPRRSIQAVFQDPQSSLSPRRTVRQTLIEPLQHFRLCRGSERERRVAEALEVVGLEPGLSSRYPHQLSGGQRQRVALARALVSEPDLIVADEPVSSLDASARAKIIELIRDLRDRLGVAFLIVSHDLSIVQRLADSVLVLYRGRLVEAGPAPAVFGNPAHPYTRSLLAAAPVADPESPPPRVPPDTAMTGSTSGEGCVFHDRCPDRLAQCTGVEPGDRLLPATAGDPNTSGQRVNCHLWE